MAGEAILIVEDNDVLRQGLHALLESEGYQVHTAMHGLDALGVMQASMPDLILSDISMPEMDGFAFFERVRVHPEWVSIPFIFLTARRGREDVFAGKGMGAEDYLVKPVTRHELLTTLRSRLERSNQLQVAQLEKAYEATLIVLANAIEVRDNPTYKHVERVRDHALLIAQALGWTSGHQSHLEYGSILHDVGKIQISERIINKQGPLDKDEWDEMKKHPLIGVEMIRNIPFLVPAIPVVRHHHERWDGSGYPDGLAGEAIPLAARIVAVADALDAMTLAYRPYRRPFTAQEAYDEVMRCSGSHFDPLVVRAFQRAWEKIAPRIG